jgi:hypothetical protein
MDIDASATSGHTANPAAVDISPQSQHVSTQAAVAPFAAKSMNQPASPPTLNTTTGSTHDEVVTVQTYCFEPCGFKIHNLSDETADAAKQQAEYAISQVQPIILPPPPLTNEPPVAIDMFMFTVDKGDPTAMRKQTSAVSRLPIEALMTGAIDDRALDAMERAICALGYETRWDGARGNDRATMFSAQAHRIDQQPVTESGLDQDGVKALMKVAKAGFWSITPTSPREGSSLLSASTSGFSKPTSQLWQSMPPSLVSPSPST